MVDRTTSTESYHHSPTYTHKSSSASSLYLDAYHHPPPPPSPPHTMSLFRTFRLLANTQLVSTEAMLNQQAGVQLTTFRTYASSAPDPNQGNKSGPANEETSPSGPSVSLVRLGSRWGEMHAMLNTGE